MAARVVSAAWPEIDKLPAKVEVYVADATDAFKFELHAGPVGVQQWTTRAGIEAIRDACNAAIAEYEIARDREADEIRRDMERAAGLSTAQPDLMAALEQSLVADGC